MRSYSYLSEDERDQGVLRAAGRSIGAIARAILEREAALRLLGDRLAEGWTPNRSPVG